MICAASLGNGVTEECNKMASKVVPQHAPNDLDVNFGELCSAMRTVSKCYLDKARGPCGESAVRLLEANINLVFDSIVLMLQLMDKVVPAACISAPIVSSIVFSSMRLFVPILAIFVIFLQRIIDY
ncbi:hypothetical protein Ddc_21828 [Ditylenchus destructor]|nr:hypothetical protein Ddc_21828 [Ditylenchus destructor]